MNPKLVSAIVSFKTMAAIILDPDLRTNKDSQNLGVVIEEIEGLLRVYKDGNVERFQIVPSVKPSLALEQGVISRDIVIDKCTNIWARFYVPICHGHIKLPLLVYFHGGGFCVGSAAWSCYHEFLSKLANKLGCLIMSVNYRLAPENPLPAAYEDGFKALVWLKQQAFLGANQWWSKGCDFTKIFVIGDSAGANIAYNVATKLACSDDSEAMSLRPLVFKGTILVQPFFGGEARTSSEKCMAQSSRSVLSLAASDTYWRLALPVRANRDHQWCNPLAKGSKMLENLRLLPTLVCISETDILKDRNLEFCAALAKAGKKVECLVYKGVGHAFQILNKSQISQTRTHQMMAHIRAFISR